MTATQWPTLVWPRMAAFVRRPGSRLWLFGFVFAAQLGHLGEHISVAILGYGLLGPAFDSEWSHFLFNGAIAILSVVLIAVYPRNPWVYPLCAISLFHEAEHVYILSQYLQTGATGGPGLLGLGGLWGIVPITRWQLHNIYNGFEVVLLMLGFIYETETLLAKPASRRVREADLSHAAGPGQP
jgi:hypothetical protein